MEKDDGISLRDLVLEMRDELKGISDKFNDILPDHKENTSVRKKVVSAVAGVAFIAVCALGTAVLKVTGILHLGK